MTVSEVELRIWCMDENCGGISILDASCSPDVIYDNELIYPWIWVE